VEEYSDEELDEEMVEEEEEEEEDIEESPVKKVSKNGAGKVRHRLIAHKLMKLNYGDSHCSLLFLKRKKPEKEEE